MTMVEFMTGISKIYEPGCVKFYSRFNPDPWQSLHDRIEIALPTLNEEVINAACSSSFEDAIRLTKAYKAGLGHNKVEPIPQEAFYKPEIVQQLENKIKVCASCGSGLDLSIVSTGPKRSDYKFLCVQHKAAK